MKVPNNMHHLAIIPDGNRRWAKQNKLKTFFGHKKGIEAVQAATNVCLKNKIQHLSIYIFSLENFRREAQEKKYLFNLLISRLKKYLPIFIKQNIRVQFVGDRMSFPDSTQALISNVEEETSSGKDLNLNLLFCYGSQQEVVHAARTLAKKVEKQEIKADDISVNDVKNALWTSSIPDPDLFIRTGNVFRLSNFLLFQMAYTEFMFLDCFWPEVTEKKLQDCIDSFNGVKRNFGT